MGIDMKLKMLSHEMRLNDEFEHEKVVQNKDQVE